MKHLFVVNPVAGKQKPEEKLRLINEAIDRLPAEQRSRDEFEIYVTEAPMDACRHIRGTAADGADVYKRQEWRRASTAKSDRQYWTLCAIRQSTRARRCCMRD